mgnify:CR=1 FL=1
MRRAIATLLTGLLAAPAAGEPAAPLERLDIAAEAEGAGLTGKGVRIAVISEAVDTAHPLLVAGDIEQLRMFLDADGWPLPPEPSEPALSAAEWHGTHVAGIIGAHCSAGAQRGVACGAQLRVHDFGAYGDFPWHRDDPAVLPDPETAFLRRLAAAFDAEAGADVANLSFNVEGPYMPLSDASPKAQPLDERLAQLAVPFDLLFSQLAALVGEEQIAFSNPQDEEALMAIGLYHDDPPALVYALILPGTSEWRDLAAAVGRFQQAGGIVVISEANNRLDERSGVLNAMPAIEQTVDPERWLSVVYVRPNPSGGFYTPLNGCGRSARSFCLSVRADEVLAPAAGGGGLRAESGHSMAAPMVSGLIALLIEQGRAHDPEFDAADALRILHETARRDFPGYDPDTHGMGLLDAAEALRKNGEQP